MPNFTKLTAAEVLALITLLENLAPEAVTLVKNLMDRLKGATPEQVAAITRAINAATIVEIDAEEKPR